MRLRIFTLVIITIFVTGQIFAGNPDRQGQAGAPELLMNPWAKSAGLNMLNTATIMGVGAMRLNPAGLANVENLQVVFGHTVLFQGAEMSLSSFGFAKKFGETGSFGVSLMALNLGEIPITTYNKPDGNGASYKPTYFNIGFSYAYRFEKVAVGALVRLISESVANTSAFGFALDAGIQYNAGDNDQYHFGVSLRNIGSRMKYTGEGLYKSLEVKFGETVNVETPTSEFEIPTLLNIGIGYDIMSTDKNKLTGIANFTANSFSRDQIGAGFEYTFNKLFSLRAAYQYEIGSSSSSDIGHAVYTGIAGGFSIDLPMGKDTDRKFALDYGYRTTNPFSGTHNLGIRFDL